MRSKFPFRTGIYGIPYICVELVHEHMANRKETSMNDSRPVDDSDHDDSDVELLDLAYPYQSSSYYDIDQSFGSAPNFQPLGLPPAAPPPPHSMYYASFYPPQASNRQTAGYEVEVGFFFNTVAHYNV